MRTLLIHACFYDIFVVGLGGVLECFAQALRRDGFDFSQLLHGHRGMCGVVDLVLEETAMRFK